jgi:hypothetical protein
VQNANFRLGSDRAFGVETRIEKVNLLRALLNLNLVAPFAIASVTIFSLKTEIFILPWLHNLASI